MVFLKSVCSEGVKSLASFKVKVDLWNLSELKSSASSRSLLHRKRVLSSGKPKHTVHPMGSRHCSQSLSGGIMDLGEAHIECGSTTEPAADHLHLPSTSSELPAPRAVVVLPWLCRHRCSTCMGTCKR